MEVPTLMLELKPRDVISCFQVEGGLELRVYQREQSEKGFELILKGTLSGKDGLPQDPNNNYEKILKFLQEMASKSGRHIFVRKEDSATFLVE